MTQITDDMVERAAQSIRDTTANRSGKGRPWAALPVAIRHRYRLEAHNALWAALAPGEPRPVMDVTDFEMLPEVAACLDCGELFNRVPNSGDKGRCDKCRPQA